MSIHSPEPAYSKAIWRVIDRIGQAQTRGLTPIRGAHHGTAIDANALERGCV